MLGKIRYRSEAYGDPAKPHFYAPSQPSTLQKNEVMKKTLEFQKKVFKITTRNQKIHKL
jgi:hypothetical protein